ncbi:MAG: hypothetical protein NZ843_04175, partial [Fimbriimonadales bacterium]|nr:hypothetical protein [Fimbriimonadales bacterium]
NRLQLLAQLSKWGLTRFLQAKRANFVAISDILLGMRQTEGLKMSESAGVELSQRTQFPRG